MGDIFEKGKTKHKSSLLILQTVLCTLIFLLGRTTGNSVTLFITAYNLAVVCHNCNFESQLIQPEVE